MKESVDLNCDMGEQSLSEGKNIDADIMPFISSCNIATGAHAGDLETMVRTMYLADQHNVAIGIHPSYVDREHFGRVSRKITVEALATQLLRQFDVFLQITEKLNFKIHHCKPHGALYHDLSLNEQYAEVFIGVVEKFDPSLIIYGMSESRFAEKVNEAGLAFKHEVFADRRYLDKRSLVSRKEDNALLDEEKLVLKQIDQFINEEVHSIKEGVINLTVDTICLHSDTPDAVNLSKKIHRHLEKSNVSINKYM